MDRKPATAPPDRGRICGQVRGDQYGAVRVDLRHRHQPTYDPQFWAGMPPTPHFLVMQRDLEKSRPLARQFAHNHWDNLVSPGDSLAIVRRYSRKYQAFLQNQN